MATRTGLDVDLFGDEELKRKLTSMRGRLLDLRPPLRDEVAPALRNHAREMFQTQGRAGGRTWRGLSPWTIRARSAGEGYYGSKGSALGFKPLRASGELARSYTDRTSSKHVEDIHRGRMEWGSKHPLAHLHAQGPRSRGSAPALPSRPVIAFKDSGDVTEIFNEPIRDYVLREFEGR